MRWFSWLPTLTKLAGASTAKNQKLDGYDIWPAINSGDHSSSPRTEIPVYHRCITVCISCHIYEIYLYVYHQVNIAACGADFKGQTIVDGPQAAMIVGDLKVIVDCWWRSTKDVGSAQVYNLSTDPGEFTNLAVTQPHLLPPLLARLSYWEQQSVLPYAETMDKEACGNGQPQGIPPHWDSWC
eukprot:SAG31_NODE_2576_length_5452_cov_2.351018_5_plen_183_part_00